MTVAFRVGVFAVFTIIGIFVVWAMLSNFSLMRNSYQIGVHFRDVVGLARGQLGAARWRRHRHGR